MGAWWNLRWGWRGVGEGYDGDGVRKGEVARALDRFRGSGLPFGFLRARPAQAAAVRPGGVMLMRSRNIAVCGSYTRAPGSGQERGEQLRSRLVRAHCSRLLSVGDEGRAPDGGQVRRVRRRVPEIKSRSTFPRISRSPAPKVQALSFFPAPKLPPFLAVIV